MSNDTGATIKRAPRSKEKPYFIMSWETAQNKELSFAALGLLTELLSRPGDWEVRVSSLYRYKASRDAIYSLLKELCRAGHMTARQKFRNDKGQWEWTPYYIFEESLPEDERILFPEKDDEDTNQPDTAKADTVSPTSAEAEIYTLESDTVEKDRNYSSEKFFADEIPTTQEAKQPESKIVPLVSQRPREAFKAVLPGQPTDASSASVPLEDKKKDPPRRVKTQAAPPPEEDTFEDWLIAVLEQFGHRHFYRTKADLKSAAMGQYVKAAKELKEVARLYNEASPDKVSPDILKTYWGGVERKGWLFTKKEMPVTLTGPLAMPKYLLEYLQSSASPMRKAAAKTKKPIVQVFDSFNLDDV